MLFAILAVMLLPLLTSAHTFSYRLDPHAEDCFYDDISRAGLRFYAHFAVLEGTVQDVDLVIYAPGDKIVYETYATKERRILFTTEDAGTYRLCFSNRMSTQSTKVIALTVHIGDPLLSEAGSKAIGVVESSILRITEGLKSIKQEQEYLRVRERVHRDTAEDTNSRILWWGLLEIVLLVAMAGWQLLHLRRLVSKERRV